MPSEKNSTHIICNLSVIPVRAEAKEASEMVTQMIFGETAMILKAEEKWLQIKIDHDGYEGWIDRKMATELSSGDYQNILQTSVRTVLTPYSRIKTPSGVQMVPCGSLIREDLVLEYNRMSTVDAPVKIDTALVLANEFFNAPYLWGGRTAFGIDCSGFVQIIYRLMGINIPRDASEQIKAGKTVSGLELAQPGHLAFFGQETKITHVGVILKNQKIIHASGKVRIDSITNDGIINSNSGQQTHKLVSIKKWF